MRSHKDHKFQGPIRPELFLDERWILTTSLVLLHSSKVINMSDHTKIFFPNSFSYFIHSRSQTFSLGGVFFTIYCNSQVFLIIFSNLQKIYNGHVIFDFVKKRRPSSLGESNPIPKSQSGLSLIFETKLSCLTVPVKKFQSKCSLHFNREISLETESSQ